MNPNNEIDRGRLFRAVEWSYGKLDPFRKLNSSLVEEYTPPGYGQPGRKQYAQHLALMNQAVDAIVMGLAANQPRVLVTTRHEGLKYFARHFQEAVNNLAIEIHLGQTFRQAVLDAIFCVGLVKIHMADSPEVQVEPGLWMDPGIPFVSNLGLDNWVHDMAANEWHKIQLAGDCYRITHAALRDPALYEQSVAKHIRPTSKNAYAGEEARLETISRGETTDWDELEPMVDCTDIWIPRDKKIYTFPISLSEGRIKSEYGPVAVMDWKGPETGPYEKLGFHNIPQNIMPSSPASKLSELGRLVNNLWRKQADSAKDAKEVFAHPPGSEGDAGALQRAGHGKFVVCQDPKDIEVKKVGGIQGDVQAFLVNAIDMFDRFGGNIPNRLGLGPSAGTLGQEEMIAGQVSRQEAQMQVATVEFERDVLKKAGWLLWMDAVKEIPAQIPVENAEGYSTDATWRPDYREGSFLDYNFEIDVYSLPYQSPAARANALMQLLTQVYIPAGEMLSAQGGSINFAKLSEIQAELMNIPRLREVVQFGQVPAEQAPGPLSGPSSSKREYVRRNVPTAGTQQSRSKVQQAEWLGMNSQNTPQQLAV